MSYFKVSYETLQTLARSGRHDLVAGFLVLARHASGRRHAGFEPYKLSGASVNGLREKAGLSEETARGVLDDLQRQGLIQPTSPETKKAFFHARWEVVQGPLDLDLPHAITDGVKDGSADSALMRLQKHRIASPAHAERLSKVSDTELRLDALMLMLGVYKHTSMQRFGGLNPLCIRRAWNIKSRQPKAGGVRWGAEPDHENTSVAYTVFMKEVLGHMKKMTEKSGDLTDEARNRFWNAWHVIREAGLVYEAVSLYDTEPDENPLARFRMTIRVNDYHAGSTTKTGDPSLLREIEDSYGTKFGYYTRADNEREEPEAMWVILPDARGALVGIWRPRFRCSNQDAGAWIAEETQAIKEEMSVIATFA
ncbi:MAG: hypothetical protein KGL39_30685 [Patescibacteria group bacterium]|nr:hypothetical protein [Patescibacteria group bacterium]